jgi:hypothetical protein
MKLKHLLALLMIFLLSLASEALAQDLPSDTDESVCDGLMDEIPGLYGLCIAFCEAHDGATTIVVESPTTYPEGAEGKIFEQFEKRAGEEGPEMPCVKYVDGECPYWSQFPGFDQEIASTISQMDDVEVTEPENDSWYIFQLTGMINGELDLIELKGAKPENTTFHFPLVMWLHPYPDRITIFPGRNAEADMYERCKYDLEKMISQE